MIEGVNKNKPGKPVSHPKIIVRETGLIFDTYTEAAESVNGNRVGVYRCVLGIQDNHHGYHFDYYFGKSK